MGFVTLSLNTTFIGLGVVLVILVIGLIIKVLNTGRNHKQEAAATRDGAVVVSASREAREEIQDTTDIPDYELIAVITAAIQASMKADPHCKIRVKSFRRIPNTAPVWNMAGRTEYIAGKL